MSAGEGVKESTAPRNQGLACLAKDRSERPPSPDALAAALSAAFSTASTAFSADLSADLSAAFPAARSRR